MKWVSDLYRDQTNSSQNVLFYCQKKKKLKKDETLSRKEARQI